MDERIHYAVENTEVLRPPKQSLATFGTSVIHYYLLTKPVYSDLVSQGQEETVVREGKVIAQRPQIVTPYYLLNLFQGFEHGEEFARYVIKKYGPHEPGLLYQYKNESHSVNIVERPLEAFAGELIAKLDKEGSPLTAVIKGVDELWDVSLLKFIYDLTRNSVLTNIWELERQGLLEMEGNVPRAARRKIEELFNAVKSGQCEPYELKRELDRWGLFEEYQDRFFSLFTRR